MKSGETNLAGTGLNQYSVFTISDHYFALEISCIQEVLKFPKLTKLPNRKPYFYGTFNLRGKIVTVIDIRHLMNLEIAKDKDPEMVVLSEHAGGLIGISVDQVMDFISIEENKIRRPSRKTPSAIARYVSGYAEKENFDFIYLLDLIKLTGALGAQINRI